MNEIEIAALFHCSFPDCSRTVIPRLSLLSLCVFLFCHSALFLCHSERSEESLPTKMPKTRDPSLCSG